MKRNVTKYKLPIRVLLLIFILPWLSYDGQLKGQHDSTLSPYVAGLDTLQQEVAAMAKADSVQAATPQALQQDIKKALRPPGLSEVVSISKIVWTLITLIVGYLVINLLIRLLSNLAQKNRRREFTIKRIIPIFRILSWMFLIYIIIVGIFRPPAATVLAFFASVGVAVGFAAQDLLKNVFGGLVVMFDRPFQIGDKIEAGKYYGEVIEIGIRSTKVVSPDDSVITIPNSEFMMQYVSNANSGENNCQVVAEIFLPLDVDTRRVRKIAMEAALVSRYIYLNKPVVVLFLNEFRDRNSVLKMRLKAYVANLDKEFAFKSEMTELVIKELIREKIIPRDFYL